MISRRLPSDVYPILRGPFMPEYKSNTPLRFCHVDKSFVCLVVIMFTSFSNAFYPLFEVARSSLKTFQNLCHLWSRLHWTRPYSRLAVILRLSPRNQSISSPLFSRETISVLRMKGRSWSIIGCPAYIDYSVQGYILVWGTRVSGSNDFRTGLGRLPKKDNGRVFDSREREKALSNQSPSLTSKKCLCLI